MKRKIRTPYFEIGTKNYIYGDTVLEYAKAADAAAEKYDIDVGLKILVFHIFIVSKYQISKLNQLILIS